MANGSNLNRKNTGWNEVGDEPTSAVSAVPPASLAPGLQTAQAEPVGTCEPKESDGFIRGLVDPEAAIQRVIDAGYIAIPRGATDDKLLQAALGDVPLNDESVKQLWLAFAYDFKERLGGGTRKTGSDIMPAPARWILACVCSYANPRQLQIPTPNIFTVFEDVAFRS